MNWRLAQSESRARYLQKFDDAEVATYEQWISQLSSDDDWACLRDIQQVFKFKEGMQVLDVGAGTGALSKMLTLLPGLNLHALEPAAAMLRVLQSKPELRDVIVHQAFCDAVSDQQHFAPATFDVIVSRQLVNGLYDPLAAFRNWHHWLKPNGSVLIIDGLYDRTAWAGKWEEEVDSLPMSACRTTAMTPYLLEASGFHVDCVGYMRETNALVSTRTIRYLVVASP